MDDDQRPISGCDACEEMAHTGELSRRGFAAASVVTGLAAAGAAQAGARQTTDTMVNIKTPDGTCDTAMVRPAGAGSWPVVILWPDIVGLRPVMREMAARMAADGYTVLVPNPFYRSVKAPAFGENFQFGGADMAKANEYRKPLTPAAVARDAVALIGFADTQPSVKRTAKAGTVGFCMGGPMVMQTVAALPDRFGAGVSFHGAGLVTDGPDSPHLLIPKMKASLHYGIAVNDDQRQPDAKDRLRATHSAAKVPATIEVYPGANHGWMVPGGGVYNQAQAERGWATMMALYKSTLV